MGKRNQQLKRRSTARRTASYTRKRVVPARGVNQTVVPYLKLFRVIIASLPISGVHSLLALFDMAFNLISTVLNTVKLYNGAYATALVTPGTLVANSPLLAQVSSGYSFPGYPISVTWINIKIRNTTQLSEKSGRWAAVFIPFVELHDAKHYTTALKDFTFREVAAMPYARTATASQDLRLTYKMRDKSAYCSRPRELNEALGLFHVIWDVNPETTELSATAFSCELEIAAGCRPHVIFGPTHRISFSADTFKVKALTDGTLTRCHFQDGSIIHMQNDFTQQNSSPASGFEMIQSEN